MLRDGNVLHLELVNKIKGLGYQLDDGMCTGIAYVGLMTLLEGRPGIFNDILLNIINLMPAEIAILKAKRNGSNKTPYSEKERNIVAFFDGVEMFHIPDKYKHILGNKDEIITQNQRRALEFLITNKLKAEGGVNAAENFVDVYTLPKLINYFSTLRESIHATKYTHPFALIIESSNHTLCINYDFKNECWFMIDAGNLPGHAIHSDEDMARTLIGAFYCKDSVILSSTLFHTRQHDAAIAPCLEEWRRRMDKREEVRIDKANITDAFGANWLYLAAQKGREELVRSLLASGANVDQPQSDSGGTPLFIAVQENHLQVVNDLMLYGANPNKLCKNPKSSPLGYALDTKNWRMAVAILIRLKDEKQINSGDRTIIHQNRHALAEAFCKLMETQDYKENYASFVNDVMASRNALGQLLNDPTDKFAILFTRSKYEDKKVTKSIKLIGDWFDGRKRAAPKAGF
jgi:hypothetical protein